MTTAGNQYTNKLQTLANSPQTRTNWLPTTRQSQMVWLAALTALTLVGQYAMLGAVGLGHTPEILPGWFKNAELILWGLRGLVEIAVVVYVGMTTTEDERKQRVLWGFKVAMIFLIVLTVGPVWISNTLQAGIVETVTVVGVYIWGSALAGISAVMLAAVAYAYKVQPVNSDSFVLPQSVYDEMLATVDQALADVGKAETKRDEALVIVDEAMEGQRLAENERDRALVELEAMRRAVAVLKFLPPSAWVRLIALFADSYPDTRTLADEFGLSESTVRGVFAKVDRE